MKMYNMGKVFGEEFIMVESDVYFEPYHNTFKVLKTLTEDTFPLVKNIVNIEVSSKETKYYIQNLFQNFCS